MRFCLICQLAVLLLVTGCSGSAVQPSNYRTYNDAPDNRPHENKNIQSMLDKRSIRDGDKMAVLTTANTFYKGTYDRRNSENNKLSILVSDSDKGRYYMMLQASMIKEIYEPSEAVGIEEKINADRRIKELSAQISKSIYDNDIDLLEKIVKEGVDIQQSTKNDYQSSLHRAAQLKERGEIIQFLLSQGIDIDTVDKYGSSPLMSSIESGNFDNARVLIESGASLNLKNNDKRTAVMIAFNKLRWSGDDTKDDVQEFIDYLVDEHNVNPDVRFDDPVYKADNSLGMNGLRLIELSEKQCHEILDRNTISYKRLSNKGDVTYPVQLLSPVSGITYRHTGRSKKHSIMDCRLVVALIGMGSVLQNHNVESIEHMRTFTQGARVGGNGRISGHNYALAIDVSEITTSDGKKYNVYKDWKDRRYRVEPCKAQQDDDQKQAFLRKVICDIANQDIFHWIFTPHYNKAHYDHFHIEIRNGESGLVFR